MWAAWWSGPPTRVPFRKPDASHGGSASREAAWAEAEAAAGRTLHEIDWRWARGWNRILRGQDPFSPADLRALDGVVAPKTRRGPRPPREVLGVGKDASLDEVKAAFRKRAFETHPDRGGDPEEFREVHEAYERLVAKAR
ncbi:MAG: DnaJ domain-containing protein [Myxococcales bacterium]|nr:DnaJ domain-containing protein [Myxococcales bacterium]